MTNFVAIMVLCTNMTVTGATEYIPQHKQIHMPQTVATTLTNEAGQVHRQEELTVVCKEYTVTKNTFTVYRNGKPRRKWQEASTDRVYVGLVELPLNQLKSRFKGKKTPTTRDGAPVYYSVPVGGR